MTTQARYSLTNLVAAPAAIVCVAPAQGSSDQAGFLWQQNEALQDELWNVESVGYRGELAELDRLASECSVPNWNGCGAPMATEWGYGRARSFLLSLPKPDTVRPTLAVDADGSFAFEWYAGRNYLLTVSVEPDGRLYYAARLGAEVHHGSAQFACSAPATILSLIARVAQAARGSA